MDTLPEIFVDAFGEISFKHGMIRVELVSLSGPEPRVTMRLITSLQAFMQILQAQNGMREQLEKAGVIRPPASAAPHAEPEPERAGVITAAPRLSGIAPVPESESEVAPRPAALSGSPRSPNFSQD